MADNTKQNDNATIAGDDIGGVLHQRVKVQHGTDGSATDVSGASPLPVGDGAVIALLEEGTLSIVGVVAISGTVDPRGNVAHDGADSGNPVKVGGRARTALPAAVAQNDRADFVTDKHGRQLVTEVPLDECVSATLNRVNTEAGQLLAALLEGAYVVTSWKVTNGHASVGTKVELLDGEAVKDRGYAGPNGGGWATPCRFVCSKNTALKAKCATTGADVDITVSAYKIPA